jgi:hypothetical protein
MNLCTAFGHDFGSVTAFDKHRVGKHSYDYSGHRPDGRRCLTESELMALGMSQDSLGRYRLPSRGSPPWAVSPTT